MIKKILKYLRIGNSPVLHKVEVAHLCFYWLRRTILSTDTFTKKRGDRVCDECQRLMALAKKK